ncbi:TPA: hypothetical protein GX533_01365 [Candidatus Dojkabacteria bacterium]|uniref:Uncharacterized protein n=1 Tax=Candidatus Dojkabacteria bacterium TaxID=2099670 RepID=A0A832QC42_9BACT|nr:hypothetical protein [Candidatus Dojkabacteria bacterium]
MNYKTHPTYPNQIILFETDHWFIALWENQYYLGRASIEYKDLSKRHLSELTEDEVFAHHYDKTKEKYVDKQFLIVLRDKKLSHWEIA